MNVLMIYPKIPDTFWSFKHALKFVSKKAVEPPLGLLTVAAMLPSDWGIKVVDLNVSDLNDIDLQWADTVFISAMIVQKESSENVIKRCNKHSKKIVAGGPLFTSEYEEFPEVDHFVLNEAELTLSGFLEDLQNGSASHIYKTFDFADITETPPPRYDLINLKSYASIGIQFSRGCPHHCDFCNITSLFGKKVRTKNKEQIITELENIFQLGWRGGVNFVDDNFIGNKKVLKNDILPAIIEWMTKRKFPFTFATEVTVKLADDDELLDMMNKAGFDALFVGIETPNMDSLAECGKNQNMKTDLAESIKKFHKHGFQVKGGFIVGFDSDPATIFETQINFIQNSNIITAMVGLLNAPPDTRLYYRLKEENRIINYSTGNNTDSTMNFIPNMDYQTLITGYREIIRGIYSLNPYYHRIKGFLQEFKINAGKRGLLKRNEIGAFFKSVWYLGIREKGRRYYWKLLVWSLFTNPKRLPLAITFAIYGFHFRKVFSDLI